MERQALDITFRNQDAAVLVERQTPGGTPVVFLGRDLDSWTHLHGVSLGILDLFAWDTRRLSLAGQPDGDVLRPCIEMRYDLAHVSVQWHTSVLTALRAKGTLPVTVVTARGFSDGEPVDIHAVLLAPLRVMRSEEWGEGSVTFTLLAIPEKTLAMSPVRAKCLVEKPRGGES